MNDNPRPATVRTVMTAALVTVATVAGVLAVGGPAIAQEDDKVTFVYGDTSEPSSLNPFKGYLATEFYFWAWTYHLPITFAVDDLGAVPDLVTEVQTSPDGKTFTYTLRDDVRWSDGKPLTAEDVEWTLNAYQDKSAYLPQNYLKLLDRIEATGEYTVELHSRRPTSLFSGAVPYMYTYILPKHVWSQYEKPKEYEPVPNVGSGPFVVTEYKRGQFVRMERNKYWNGPEPHIDEIVYRIFNNEDAEAEALKRGEIDFGYFDSANVLNSLKDEENIATHVGTIPSFDEIGMNTGSAIQPAEEGFEPHGDGHPALADPVVRQAMRMAIDSQTLVDKILLGYGEPGTSIVPPVSIAGARWEPAGDDLLAFDPDGANALLEENGYVDTDGDGVREMPDGGRPLEFRYYTQTNDQNTIKTAPFVQAWLEDIGIKANVSAMTSGRLGDELVAGTYDLFHWGWIPDPDPDSILSYFQCNQRPPDENTYGNNDAFYCNPRYDELYLEQRTTTDPEQRLEVVQEMQRIFYEDSPYVVLWYGPTLQAYRTDTFAGYKPQPAPNGDLLNGYSRDAVLNIRPASEAVPTEEPDQTESPGESPGATPSEGPDGEDSEGPQAAPSSDDDGGGIPAAVWVAVVAIFVLVLVVAAMLRRRRTAEDRE